MGETRGDGMGDDLDSGPDVRLRDVTDADLPVFYEHQRDPEATGMAAFPARDWDAFVKHGKGSWPTRAW
jgi:hypothetical protein